MEQGLVLMRASLLSVPYFCSRTISLKLPTDSVGELLININSNSCCWRHSYWFRFSKFRSSKIFDAAKVLRDDHAQTILPTRLLENDIEMVNNFSDEEPHSQNEIVINMYP